jgi:adenylate cyclase
MPASPPSKIRSERTRFNLYELLQTWWRHRVSFLMSLLITISALSVYYLVFIQESKTPLSEFAQRLEWDTLDTRFRYRARMATHPDPRIVIVDIDQRSQEILGRFPFSRTNFVKMLDALRDDGAKVAGFDITFSKPEVDPSAASLRALRDKLERKKKAGDSVDSRIVAEIEKLAKGSDADGQFADAIRRFGPVVLGNFFLYSAADLRGVTDASLDEYAHQLEFFGFPTVLGKRDGFKKQDRIALIEDFNGAGLLPKGAEANIAPLTTALSGDLSSVGFFNAPPDADGVIRRATLILPYGRSQNLEDWDLYGSLDLMTTRAYLGTKPEETILTYGPVGIDEIQLGPHTHIHPDGRGQIMINYQGATGTFPHYSMADVASRNFTPGTFTDKIVLVGATATGIGDLKTTPFGGTNYPGVEIHANVIDNILNDRFLKRGAKQALTDFLLILAFGIPLGIWMALVSPRWMWFGLALLAPLAAVDYFAFLRGWWLNFSVPGLTLIANVLLVSLYRALIEEKEKRRVRTAFGQYLSPEVIRRLLLNPQLVEPRKTDITVMFSDIRGFTTISEKLDAQELALFLNQYLLDMTRLVFESQGTLDKYIGDAVMAFWGAPFEEEGHAIKGCISALEMMKHVRAMQKKWAEEGKPHLDIGIGLNTGVASVGNMGSSLRYGYTALGDTVNLSSRLEGLNKDYGTHILVNETTYAAVQGQGFFFRELDLIRVKGKFQPVILYELIGREGEPSVYGGTEELRTRMELFVQARDLYRKRQWEPAQKIFQAILDKWADDGPSRTYWKRCQEYLFEEPPSGWDGVFTMTHK